MTDTDLDGLMADTEMQLDMALQAVGAGELIDLSDLVPRIDVVCTAALAQRRKSAADQLARIIVKLDAVQAVLREQVARLGGETKPDPKRAAESYHRAAATPSPPADERK